MSKNLLIVGAGMYGFVVKEIAKAMGVFEKISFVDDNCQRDDVLGKTDMLKEYLSEYKYGLAAIGNPDYRKKCISLLENAGYTIPVLIHPKAYVSESAQIGLGSVVEPMAVVHSNASVGKGCFICAGSVVNHNAVVEEFCQVDCNATIGAGVIVQCGTKVVAGQFYRKN